MGGVLTDTEDSFLRQGMPFLLSTYNTRLLQYHGFLRWLTIASYITLNDFKISVMLFV